MQLVDEVDVDEDVAVVELDVEDVVDVEVDELVEAGFTGVKSS